MKIIDSPKLDVQKFLESSHKKGGDKSNKPKPKTECPGDASDVPSKWFLNQTSVDFCKVVMGDLKKPRPSRVYDVRGNSLPRLKSRSHGGTMVDKRTPPENIERYKDYRVTLMYEPLEGDCMVDKENLCKNAYEKLVESNCKCNEIAPSPFGTCAWQDRKTEDVLL